MYGVINSNKLFLYMAINFEYITIMTGIIGKIIIVTEIVTTTNLYSRHKFNVGIHCRH